MHKVVVCIHICVYVYTYTHRPEKKTILLEKAFKLQIQTEVWFLWLPESVCCLDVRP